MVKSIDKGLLASARESARRNFFVTVGALSLLAAAAPHSFAQTAGGGGSATTQTYTLGTYGPGAADYSAAAQGFATNVGGILTAILGLLLVVLAVWKGPGLIKKAINKYVPG